MKKTLFMTGILAFVLVFGMAVLGCSDGGGEEPDTWKAVTSPSQLDGTWKRTNSHTETITEGVTSKENIEVTLIINTNAKTMTSSQKNTITLSGSGNIFNTVWNTYKITNPPGTYPDEDGNTYTTTIDDATHTITVTYSPQTKTYTDAEIADMLSGVQINQNGTKMKVPSSYTGVDHEMIFYKQ